MDEFPEDMFDEKKIKKAVTKGKRKTIFTIIIVSMIVFVVFTIGNFMVSTYFSQKAFKQWDAYVRLSTPNAYISEAVDYTGLLGGHSNYKVSKDMKIKAVVIEQNQYQFGLNLSLSISRGAGSHIGMTGEDWQLGYKENGWRELIFFHPNVAYQKYQNDEELINNMVGDKIYEVALSFDKPYQQNELPLFEFPAMTWFWLDTYTDQQLNTFREEAKEQEWSSTFIQESEALGFSANSFVSSINELDNEYKEFLNLLQTSDSPVHQSTYDRMKEQSIEDIEILGIVIYGTKNEIVEIIKKPFVKAASLGGVIDDY